MLNSQCFSGLLGGVVNAVPVLRTVTGARLGLY